MKHLIQLSEKLTVNVNSLNYIKCSKYGVATIYFSNSSSLEIDNEEYKRLINYYDYYVN